MICPKCGCEYREGFTECADCYVDLIEKIEDTESVPEVEVVYFNAINVYTPINNIETSWITDLLKENGIYYRIDEKPTNYYTGFSDSFSYTRGVLVDQSDYYKAKSLIDEFLVDINAELQ